MEGEFQSSAKAMTRLETDPSRDRDFRAAWRGRAEEDLTFERMLGRTHEVYRRVTQRPRTGLRRREAHSGLMTGRRGGKRRVRRHESEASGGTHWEWRERA